MRFGNLGLGLAPVGAAAPRPPIDVAWGGSHSVAEDAELGAQVGGDLSVTDPDGLPVTYSLVDDANGYFAVDGVHIIVTGVLDFETTDEHSITVRATNSSGAFYDEVFAVTVTDVSETSADDPPPGDGDVIVDDPGNFDTPPYAVVVDGAVKFAGKKKANGLSAKVLHDFSDAAPLESDTIYTIRWTTDFSLMAQQGELTAVGLVFKTGNDFWFATLRGDGSGGVDVLQIYGDNLWNQLSGFTEIDGGAAQHGSIEGPNWFQLQTSADGTTVTIRTSDDGDPFVDEFADADPLPFGNISEVTQWGLGAIFHSADSGPYVIVGDLWTSAEPIAISGALIKKSSDQTTADYSTATIIDWAVASYDSSGFFSAGSPSKLIVPAAFDGKRVVLCACVEISSLANDSNISLEILKNGSDSYDGRAGNLRNSKAGANNTTKAWLQCSTQPIVAATGDEWQAKLSCSDPSVTIEAENSSFSIQVVEGTFDGVLLKKAADEIATSYVFADIAWDTEVVDTGGYHAGGDPSRITVSAGANNKYGVLKSNIHLSAVSAANNATASRIMRGDSASYSGAGALIQTNGGFTDFWFEIETAAVPLTTDQFFEMNVFCSDFTINFEQEHSTFSLQVFDSITGALVKKSADQTPVSYQTPTVITWDAEVYDSSGFHDIGSNTSRFTVPPELDGRYAIFRANVVLTAFDSNNTASLCILKNGSDGYDGFGGSQQECAGLGDMWIGCRTQPVRLNAGDIWEAQLWSQDPSMTVVAANSSFSVRVLDEPT